jgi:hypothetical protein
MERANISAHSKSIRIEGECGRRPNRSANVSIGSALEDADFAIEALDEAESDLVLRLAVCGDARKLRGEAE